MNIYKIIFIIMMSMRFGTKLNRVLKDKNKVDFIELFSVLCSILTDIFLMYKIGLFN